MLTLGSVHETNVFYIYAYFVGTQRVVGNIWNGFDNYYEFGKLVENTSNNIIWKMYKIYYYYIFYHIPDIRTYKLLLNVSLFYECIKHNWILNIIIY